MSDVYKASICDALWHKMRDDLAKFAPQIIDDQLLMCCACGRFLPRDCFDLEHLVPQQALRKDPPTVTGNPLTTVNIRAGNLLLCKKPLRIKDKVIYQNGCNSWKGRFYDRALSDLVAGKGMKTDRNTETHIIAALSLAYLAMVAEFGYIVALMPSGRLMREQFFNHSRFHPALPVNCQMLLGGQMPVHSPEARLWSNPFSFTFSRPGICVVGIRNIAVFVPISRDPSLPFSQHLRIVPSKYKLRPDFSTVFNR